MSYCLGECRVFLTLPETFVSDTSNHVLLVAGSVLDALELCSTIDDNLHDADRKIGKKTYSSAAEISGSWAGSALGAKGGAWAGAAIGTAVLPGVGTAVGGIAGGLVLGVWRFFWYDIPIITSHYF